VLGSQVRVALRFIIVGKLPVCGTVSRINPQGPLKPQQGISGLSLFQQGTADLEPQLSIFRIRSNLSHQTANPT